MKRYVCLLALLLAALSSFAVAQTKPATIIFTYDRPGLSVPHFILEVDEAGHGRYQADELPPVPAKFAQSTAESAIAKPVVQHIDRPLELSRPTVESIFRAAHSLNFFNIVCAAKLKNVANTGDKTLAYSGPDGTGSCAYNYSENKTVEALTNIFLNIAFTLDEGRKLDFDHRYDRLGLDEDMEQLVKAVEEKRALEIGTIATTLSAIIDDTAVMQRVRQRAATLLEQAKQTMQAAN